MHTTKKQITDSLFSLMAHDPIERITVGEVCVQAQINRSTFYNHFADIYDVRDRCEEKIMSAAGEMLPALMRTVLLAQDIAPLDTIVEKLKPYSDHLNVLLNGGDPNFPSRLRAIAHDALQETLHIERFSDEQEYIFHAIAGMQFGLIGHWLATGQTMSLVDLTALIRLLMLDGPRAALLHIG